jgi:hypothetical protein
MKIGLSHSVQFAQRDWSQHVSPDISLVIGQDSCRNLHYRRVVTAVKGPSEAPSKLLDGI